MTRRARLERERHIRAISFFAASLTLALAGYSWASFDQLQTLAYGVMAYCILNLMNFRFMFQRFGQALEK